MVNIDVENKYTERVLKFPYKIAKTLNIIIITIFSIIWIKSLSCIISNDTENINLRSYVKYRITIKMPVPVVAASSLISITCCYPYFHKEPL